MEKIILDVDTGTDDAVAIVMAILSEEFDLLGICAVNGNIELKLTTDNSLRVVDLCKSSAKVYRGADLPLVSTLRPWSMQSRYPLPHREGMYRPGMIHSQHLPLPETGLNAEDECAVSWLIRTLLASEDREITLVVLGPATNIALAMRADPRIMKKIKRIVAMAGGDHICNSTSASEFNVFADPEAYEIMLQSGCDITLVPLDATYTATITCQEAEEIRAIGTPPAGFVADVIQSRIEAYGKRDADMQKETPLHDPLALCAVTHPDVLTDVRDLYCSVDLGSDIAYGRTVLDWRQRFDGAIPNCHFALSADKGKFLGWLRDILVKDKARW